MIIIYKLEKLADSYRLALALETSGMNRINENARSGGILSKEDGVISLKILNAIGDLKFDPMNPLNWFSEIVHEGEMFKATEGVILRAILRKIPAEYTFWANTLKEEFEYGNRGSLERLKEKFKQKFQTEVLKRKKAEELYYMKQEMGQSTREFIYQYQTVYEQTGPLDAGEKAMILSLEGKLHPDIRIQLEECKRRNEPINVELIKIVAEEVEKKWEMVAAYNLVYKRKRREDTREESNKKRSRTSTRVEISSSESESDDSSDEKRKRKRKNWKQGTESKEQREEKIDKREKRVKSTMVKVTSEKQGVSDKRTSSVLVVTKKGIIKTNVQTGIEKRRKEKKKIINWSIYFLKWEN